MILLEKPYLFKNTVYKAIPILVYLLVRLKGNQVAEEDGELQILMEILLLLVVLKPGLVISHFYT
ncbi:hypothetical protein XNW1_3130001 [Xenorhabdus nematophila str. Websteri]|nr:hypothetical protein XNW1_3130001 [Xenorhabdus nematophila str. Websteri]